MGWKNVKEHYGIEHPVRVTDAGFCIGSQYIHNILVYSPEGELLNYSPEGRLLKGGDRRLGNEDLERYREQIGADPDRFRELYAAPDTFAASIPAWTFEGSTIIEKRCEEFGWPNLTHDGQIIDSDFSETREGAIAIAIHRNQWIIRGTTQRLKELKEKLAGAYEYRNGAKQAIAELMAQQFGGYQCPRCGFEHDHEPDLLNVQWERSGRSSTADGACNWGEGVATCPECHRSFDYSAYS